MKGKIILLVFCTMGFMLLFVVGLMERSVVSLLINDAYQVSEDNLRLTFSALQRIVGVLPYTLGIIIAGTLILSILQAVKSKGNWFSIAVIIILLIPMIYNIFIADTAAVVEGIENTKITDEIAQVKFSLLGAVKQHYIGLIGFFMATIVQLIFTLRSVKE